MGDTGRYELLHDDERFGLRAGDILVCEPMHPAWADEKLAVLHREGDGYDPGCSVYREMVKALDPLTPTYCGICGRTH
jgi:hypothetical protein